MLSKVVICGVDTTNLPKLSNSEQIELLKKIKEGDNAAREKFIVGNMRLVLSLVRRFWAKNVNADDLFQAGCVGLIKSIDNFDLSVGVRFSTYAVPPVLGLRNRRKELKMTRKQALLSVFPLLQGKSDYEPVLNKLKEIVDNMPFVGWCKENIFDCVEDFMLENGRLPTTTDFTVENQMPPHTVIKQYFKMALRPWLDEYFPTYYRPQATRKSALKFAYKTLADNGEAQKKILELLQEYPVCKWNVENVLDVTEQFFIENGRLPYKKDFLSCDYLPDIGIINYRFGYGIREFYKQNCNELYLKDEKIKEEQSKDYLTGFVQEYNRIEPITIDEFNKNRNPKISCLAEVVMRNCNIKSWYELLDRCCLKRYYKITQPLIKSIEVIVIEN